MDDNESENTKTYAEWEDEFEKAAAGSDEEHIALEGMLNSAETIDDLSNFCYLVPDDSVFRAQALDKMVKMATNYYDWDLIFWASPEGSELEDRAAEQMGNLKE